MHKHCKVPECNYPQGECAGFCCDTTERRMDVVGQNGPTGEHYSALATQVGGGHYKALAIQPVEYIQRNNLGFCEGSVVKYVSRWRAKGGVEDLKKAKHFLDLLIEMEGKQ